MKSRLYFYSIKQIQNTTKKCNIYLKKIKVALFFSNSVFEQVGQTVDIARSSFYKISVINYSSCR